MVYNYENCKFYPECIAISADAAVFNVEIYHQTNSTEGTKIGKANVIISRHPERIGKTPNIALMIFNWDMDNSSKLQENIINHCIARCKTI